MSDETSEPRTPQQESPQPESPSIGPGYALFQMAKALTTSDQHEDAATRERAEERVAKWVSVFQGILNGTLKVGSRTPLENVPEWVTLEVVTGGFATGQLLAGGPLQEHEVALLAEHPELAEAGEDGRTLLNAYYLSEQGLARLRELLHNGHYEIDVPEEGALLVVAWLIEQGHVEAAQALLAEIGPFFGRLRFYPIPSERAAAGGAHIFLEDVGSAINRLQQIESSRDILAQKEAIELWAPLYDEVVRLFLQTVEGEPPTLHRDAQGNVVVEGGWPCYHYPDGWAMRAQRVLDEYHRLRQEHTLSAKPERHSENFTQLRGYLQRCVSEPLSLSALDVRRIRVLLARFVAKYGLPDSEQHRALRRCQERQIDIPIYKDIAQVVLARLAHYDKDGGITDLDAVTQPVRSNEAERWAVKAATAIPPVIQKKVERAVIDSIDGLVERGVITSSDTLARLLPQITSEIRAAGIADPTLRRLYAAIYRAFRRRRSLLLLNFESQIRIEELPWIAAIERFRQENFSTRDLARQTLEEVVTLALTSFPYAILPNKLLQELRTLAKGADLNIPFVDEIAADIFMGDFAPGFLYAAKRAAGLLQGTLYERYYGIDYRQVQSLDEQKPKQERWRLPDTSGNTLIALCARRAGLSSTGWSVARNGMIIEQQQILTTQNLAVLFESLHLAERLRDRLGEMVRHCFEWICRRQQMNSDTWHGHLIMIKNTAYAWRQMIFFLSFLSQAELQEFLAWAEAHFRQQSGHFLARFRPAMNGLVLAAEGRSLDAPDVDPEQVKRFLGWSDTSHWLLS
jgi:hypothetical protein